MATAPAEQSVKIGRGVGHGVVAAASRIEFLGERDQGIGDILASEHFFTDFAGQTAYVRAVLAGLGAEAREHVDAYLEVCADMVYSGRHSLEATDRGERGWSEWLSKAEDDHILAFSAAHLERLRRQVQSPAFAEMVTVQKATFTNGIRQLISSGMLHPEAEEGVEAFKRAEILIGDMFDTWLMGGAVGYHEEGGGNVIVVGQGAGDTLEDDEADLLRIAKPALVHEPGHIRYAHHLPRHRKEAIVHHIGLSTEHGQFETVDPKERFDGDSHYLLERQLMHVELSYGRRVVSVAVVGRAATAQASFEAEYAHMRREIGEAWGWPTMVDDVDRYVADAEGALREQYPDAANWKIQDAALRVTIEQLLSYSDQMRAGNKN